MSTLSLPILIIGGVFFIWASGADLKGLPQYPIALKLLKDKSNHVFACNDDAYLSLKDNIDSELFKFVHSIFYKDIDLTKIPICEDEYNENIVIDDDSKIDFKSYGEFSFGDFVQDADEHQSIHYKQGTGYADYYDNMDPTILNYTKKFYIKPHDHNVLLLLIIDDYDEFIPYEVTFMNDISNTNDFVLKFKNLKDTTKEYTSNIDNWIYYFYDLFYTYFHITIDGIKLYLVEFTKFNNIVATSYNDMIYILNGPDDVTRVRFDSTSFSVNAVVHLLNLHKQNGVDVNVGDVSTVISEAFNTYTGTFQCRITGVPETHKHHVEINDPGNIEQFGIFTIQVGNNIDLYIISIYRLLLFPNNENWIKYDNTYLDEASVFTTNWSRVNDEVEARSGCEEDEQCVGFQFSKPGTKLHSLCDESDQGGSTLAPDCALYRKINNDTEGTSIKNDDNTLHYKNWRNPSKDFSVLYTINKMATNEVQYVGPSSAGVLNSLNMISYGDNIFINVNQISDNVQQIIDNDEICISYYYTGSSTNREYYVYCQVRNEDEAKLRVHDFMGDHFNGYHHYFHKVYIESNHITENHPYYPNSKLNYVKVRVENVIDGITKYENVPLYSESRSSAWNAYRDGSLSGQLPEGKRMYTTSPNMDLLLKYFVYSTRYITMKQLMSYITGLGYLNDTYSQIVDECPIHQKLSSDGKTCEDLNCTLTFKNNEGVQKTYSTSNGTLSQTVDAEYDKWGSDNDITKVITLSGDMGCRVDAFDQEQFGAGTTLGTYMLYFDTCKDGGTGCEITLENFRGKMSSFGINTIPPLNGEQVETYTEHIEYLDESTNNPPFVGNPKRFRETNIPTDCEERSLSQCVDEPGCKIDIKKRRNRNHDRGIKECVNNE